MNAATIEDGQSEGDEELVEEDADFITGGADDLSWLIKRVTFKLHDTYPTPNRCEWPKGAILSSFYRWSKFGMELIPDS